MIYIMSWIPKSTSYYYLHPSTFLCIYFQSHILIYHTSQKHNIMVGTWNYGGNTAAQLIDKDTLVIVDKLLLEGVGGRNIHVTSQQTDIQIISNAWDDLNGTPKY